MKCNIKYLIIHSCEQNEINLCTYEEYKKKKITNYTVSQIWTDWKYIG